MIAPVRHRLLPALLVLAATVSAHAQSRSSPRWQGPPSVGSGSQSRPSSPRPRYTPGLPWWKDEVFKRDLGLTNDQAAQIDKLWVDLKPVQSRRIHERDESQKELSRLIKLNSPIDKVASQIDQVVNLDAAINKARTLQLFQMRQIMSEAQRDRFDVLHGQWLEAMGLAPGRSDYRSGPSPSSRRPF